MADIYKYIFGRFISEQFGCNGEEVCSWFGYLWKYSNIKWKHKSLKVYKEGKRKEE